MDYFAAYMEYAGAGVSEPPATFHRWTALSIVGTLLGRQMWFPFGHGRIYPNNYIMFMGNAGARKSSAINIGAKLIKKAGFTRFAPDKCSKEQFLLSMQSLDAGISPDILLELTLNEPAESLILAEEFTDFIGANNVEFINMLTKLWDNPSIYTQPKITSKSVSVNEPTVNILSGNTPQNFSVAFPPEALGSGFLSRLLLISGETTGRKQTFPPRPDDLLEQQLIAHLKEIRETCKGEITVSKEAEDLCDRIYKEFKPLPDSRFASYSTRRFTHILKLASIIMATELGMIIDTSHVMKANTILHYAEKNMSKALGEYGRARNSDLANSIMQILLSSNKPVSTQQLLVKLGQDISDVRELGSVIAKLSQSEKIRTVNKGGIQGFVPNILVDEVWDNGLLLDDWLTEEERI